MLFVTISFFSHFIRIGIRFGKFFFLSIAFVIFFGGFFKIPHGNHILCNCLRLRCFFRFSCALKAISISLDHCIIDRDRALEEECKNSFTHNSYLMNIERIHNMGLRQNMRQKLWRETVLLA